MRFKHYLNEGKKIKLPNINEKKNAKVFWDNHDDIYNYVSSVAGDWQTINKTSEEEFFIMHLKDWDVWVLGINEINGGMLNIEPYTKEVAQEYSKAK